MLLILGASFGLPGWWRVAALSAQAAFHLLVLLDRVSGRSVPQRFTSPARTALRVIAAAFCAVFYLVLAPGNRLAADGSRH